LGYHFGANELKMQVFWMLCNLPILSPLAVLLNIYPNLDRGYQLYICPGLWEITMDCDADDHAKWLLLLHLNMYDPTASSDRNAPATRLSSAL